MPFANEQRRRELGGKPTDVLVAIHRLLPFAKHPESYVSRECGNREALIADIIGHEGVLCPSDLVPWRDLCQVLERDLTPVSRWGILQLSPRRFAVVTPTSDGSPEGLPIRINSLEIMFGPTDYGDVYAEILRRVKEDLARKDGK